jgi:hypothetical protein
MDGEDGFQVSYITRVTWYYLVSRFRGSPSRRAGFCADPATQPVLPESFAELIRLRNEGVMSAD